MAVVAVLDTHIEKTAVRRSSARIILEKEPWINFEERIVSEIRRSKFEAFIALANKNPPRKRYMVGEESGANAFFALVTPVKILTATPMRPEMANGIDVNSQLATTQLNMAKNVF